MTNDRIKELALKAGLNAPYGSDREGLSDFSYRDFAALVINECILVSDHAYQKDGKILNEWEQGYNKGVARCIDNIKKIS
jgi:hypothetical protein